MEHVNELLKMVVPVEWLFSILPLGISEHAKDFDYLYWFLLITCGILFLLVIGPLVLICLRYRRKTPDQKALSQKDHNLLLESLWTFLPFVYLSLLFVWGFTQYLDNTIAPHDAKELKVIGQKWQWSVDYPTEEISVAGMGAEVVVPVDTNIKLTMSSQDVIHSFFIPNLRIKQDVLPGRYTTLWFKAEKIGDFPILCAEYCGDLHSQMLAKLRVVSRDAYLDWVDKTKAQDQEMPLLQLGTKLYTKLGCVACHSIDGSPKLAPTFKGVYGKKEELTDGTFVTVNDNYIRQSILEPQKQVTKGYAPIMPTFQGRVSERDLLALIEFIKSLKD